MIRSVRLVLVLLALAAGLAGCASTPRSAEGLPWLDQAFQHDPALVTVRPAELLVLPADLQQRLDEAPAVHVPPHARMNHLLSLLFGADRKSFGYAAGQTTPAAETWRRRTGDCLSLTMLTYAAARHLGLSAQMQEVPVPLVFDRRGGFDAVNHHVNVLLRRVHREVTDSRAIDMVVDFEPYLATGRRGEALDENAIVARYYNNIAIEHLAAGRQPAAYAHLKAAILHDPGFAAAYNNLAVLYRGAGRHAEAESVLRRAIELASRPDVPLHALHQLLVEQGRVAEARPYAERLALRRSADPYYWSDLGQRHLREGDPRSAVRALERARELASAFPEVHRHLAVAYARAGDLKQAEVALRELAALGIGDHKLSALRRKFNPVE